MKLPIAWLRDYLDIEESSEALAERLASLGFPVDAIEVRTRLSGVLTGRLTRVEKHPDADRLQICTVDVNGPRPLTIATAATNVAPGDVVPVATIGAELVGVRIAPRKMRGIDSEGMLVSAAELGLPAAWFDDGILQLEREPADRRRLRRRLPAERRCPGRRDHGQPGRRDVGGRSRARTRGVPRPQRSAEPPTRAARLRGPAAGRTAARDAGERRLPPLRGPALLGRHASGPRRSGCACDSRWRASARSTTSSTSRTS